ncbi:unnamed protein product [Didymodactylos carnosus]|uniref:RBR-type E3 ubiquitin transferase n=1 Tax=Didymodactylos carnosus TaxID=1234261 RepID=A0A8S2GNG8_9BILA|nr:unnamed protein product [Didymodactylos carnosus]CAF3538251.1 unnamed protein product [Didymodactylos carnosus]
MYPRPRHPQPQGCVERPNGILTSVLGKWMSDENSSHWSLSVVYGINTRMSSTTKFRPYEDEEQLPTPIEDSLDQTNVGDSNTNSSAIIENVPYALYPDDPQLDDTTSVAACLLGLSSTYVCTAPVLKPSFFIDNLISFDSPPSKNVSHVLLVLPRVIVLDNFVRGFLLSTHFFLNCQLWDEVIEPHLRVTLISYSDDTVEKKGSGLLFKVRDGNCLVCASTTQLCNISKNCTHPSQCCLPCIKRTIIGEITSKGRHRFVCCARSCKIEYDPNEYFHLLERKETELVDNLLLNSLLEQNDEFRWCKNPKGCGAGQLVSNYQDLLGYYACYKCHQHLCFRHSILWHQGYTCDEFDTEMENNPDLASDRYVLEFSKQCPNPKCKTPISKLEGCDVMTCCRYGTHECTDNERQFGKCDHGGKNYCGHRFCWKCLGTINIDKKGKYIRHCNANCEYVTLNN